MSNGNFWTLLSTVKSENENEVLRNNAIWIPGIYFDNLATALKNLIKLLLAALLVLLEDKSNFSAFTSTLNTKKWKNVKNTHPNSHPKSMNSSANLFSAMLKWCLCVNMPKMVIRRIWQCIVSCTKAVEALLITSSTKIHTNITGPFYPLPWYTELHSFYLIFFLISFSYHWCY